MDRVLIVDDEKNIRLTLATAISSLPIEAVTANNGEEALQKVQAGKFTMLFLDLRMPGMDGMQVLPRLRDERPEIPVVIISAHGDIDLAVEAMKLGAVEFVQKPFVPEQIRSRVSRVLDRQRLTADQAQDYATCFELAKRCLSERHVDAAIKHIHRAISISPERPEAYNLLGAIHEVRGETTEALNNYRVAWNYDASYEPARLNIERAGDDRIRRPILFGELRETLQAKE